VHLQSRQLRDLTAGFPDVAAAVARLGDVVLDGEVVVAKRLDQPYRSGVRAWQKHRIRVTAEAVVGGITGSIDAPRELILGRHDEHGRLRIAGRTTTLQPATSTRIAAVLEE
jgi:ATP-dependent DNA ligase